jgi:predicted dehydrogenase
MAAQEGAGGAGAGGAGENLRVGLIGLGAMGRHHARVIRETDGMDLVAVADPGGDRFGVAGGLSVGKDVASIIDAGIDAAMVAVPTVYHEEVALALAEAGVHTMVEKPIAHDVPAGRRVADAFEEVGLTGAVGYVERCNPAIVALREKVAENFLGEIYQIQTFRQGPFPAPPTTSTSRPSSPARPTRRSTRGRRTARAGSSRTWCSRPVSSPTARWSATR